MMQHKPSSFWFWPGLALCVLALIEAISPSGGTPAVFPGFDKVVHAAVFAVLGAWFAALHRSAGRRLIVALALTGFGVAIEILQSLTGRDTSAWDVVADVVGIAIGILLLSTITAHILRFIEDRVRAAID